MPSTRKQTSIRLSDHARELVEEMSRRTGLKITGILELAIREKAQRDGVQVSAGAGPDSSVSRNPESEGLDIRPAASLQSR